MLQVYAMAFMMNNLPKRFHDLLAVCLNIDIDHVTIVLGVRIVSHRFWSIPASNRARMFDSKNRRNRSGKHDVYVLCAGPQARGSLGGAGSRTGKWDAGTLDQERSKLRSSVPGKWEAKLGGRENKICQKTF